MTVESVQYPFGNDPNDPVNAGDPYQVSVVGSRSAYDPATIPSVLANTGSSDPMSWLNSLFPSGGSSSSIDWSNPLGLGSNFAERAGALGSALNSFNNANKYDNMASNWSGTLDPFGAARKKYSDLLALSYDNPAAFLSNPGHKAEQEHQLNILQGRLRAQGYMGSGKEMGDLTDLVTKSDAEYMMNERQRLGELAGAGISPAALGSLIQSGTAGAVKQRGDALASIAAMLAPKQSGTSGNPNSPTGTTSPIDYALQSLISQGGAGLAKIAADPKLLQAALSKGYFGSTSGGGGYGGSGTGIDPTASNAGQTYVDPTTGAITYGQNGSTGFGNQAGDPGSWDQLYSDPNYWDNFFNDMFGTSGGGAMDWALANGGAGAGAW